MRRTSVFPGFAVVLGAFAAASAETVTIDFVTVGNPGNKADTVAFNAGSVPYVYQIGKYEVTAGQYAAFLNAKAWESDPYDLYNTQMVSGWNACNIQRNAITHPENSELTAFQYTVADPDRPVNFVTFWSTIRFANWLHNGQGDGDTETGSYTVGSVNSEVVRNPSATFVVASNDEWHKAAFYNPATDSYYTYATSSNVQPTNVLPDTTGNNANVWDGTTGRGTLAVGSYENSASPYGTFDQCGNVREWTDGMNWTDGRIIRDGPTNFWASTRSSVLQYFPTATTADNQGLGFRLAYVPEPGAALLCLAGAVCLLMRRR